MIFFKTKSQTNERPAKISFNSGVVLLKFYHHDTKLYLTDSIERFWLKKLSNRGSHNRNQEGKHRRDHHETQYARGMHHRGDRDLEERRSGAGPAIGTLQAPLERSTGAEHEAPRQGGIAPKLRPRADASGDLVVVADRVDLDGVPRGFEEPARRGRKEVGRCLALIKFF